MVESYIKSRYCQVHLKNVFSEESALGLFECTDETFLQGMKTEMSDSIGSKRTRAESRPYNGSACETVKKRDFGN